ncbi:class A beta-lactamase-related serine hydrolase [Nocardia panacis]|uniref:Class A beta-lactamase-related serine hydrolase n=1 Tax=Nocardia panacis TaxID=2340916 RepID=A0A3A4JQD8_9NOCA|nr:serine hydrolase [Nocardia panacis]RJO71447.1 class A beta-lactamase-related serine hydrolase [Nocardia panacis]
MPTFSADALRRLCDDTRERLSVTGAQVAIASGDTVLQAVSGIANAELGTPVTDNTVFQIGSTTKVYTATLVLQLVDAGLVDLDTPVTHYLPGVRLAAGERWREITPRHLMAMTSGLDNGPYTDTGNDDDCIGRYLDLLAEIPPAFAPGTAYGYSNASTNVSGRLIETITGDNWDVALRERLLRPAGLVESVSLFADLPYHPTAVGHLPGATGVVRPWCFARGCGPAGSSLATTARDLARFGQLLVRRGKAADGTQVLSEQAVDIMQTVQVDVPARVFADSWCVGPYRKIWDGVEVFGHSGTTPNGSSCLLWMPAHDIAVATVVNTPSRGYPFADAIFDVIFRDWLGVAKPSRPTPDPELEFDPSVYTGRYHAHGVEYTISMDNGVLFFDMEQVGGAAARTELLPIAAHRFLPADDAVTGNHTWDIAFTLGPDGAAGHLHNGAFTARRVH